MKNGFVRLALMVVLATGVFAVTTTLSFVTSVFTSESAFAAKKKNASRSTSRPSHASRRSSGGHRARSSSRRTGGSHARRSGAAKHATSRKSGKSVSSNKTKTKIHSTATPNRKIDSTSHSGKGHSKVATQNHKTQNFKKGHANLSYKKQNKGHSPSNGNKPNFVKHNEKNKVGKLGNKHNHKATVISHHGHFYRRHYYSFLAGGLLSWYFYDDLIAPTDPDVVALAEVPVCGTEDTDDCNEMPRAAVPVEAVVSPGLCEIVIHSQKDFQGDTVVFTEDQPYVGDEWNDTISSLEAKSGKWEFFQDPDYGGDRLRLFTPHKLSLNDQWAGKISSARCIP